MSDALPRTASTVVVGGGVVGAAVAFFLADRGERDVVLVERHGLGAGSTKGGMGGIRHQFTDEIDVRLSLMASAFWRDFASFTRSEHEFAERGYLFLAETPQGLAQMKQPLPLYERLGLDVRMLDREEIEDLVPGIRTDDLAGGRVCLRDGYGDPLAALAGFAAAAVLGSVRVVEGTEAEALVRVGDRVTGVRTAAGDIDAERVLLAAGCWTAPLASTAGVRVPIWPYRRSIMETGAVPNLAGAPMTVEWESGFHFRPIDGRQRFAMPNLGPSGEVEKGPAGPPGSFERLGYPPLEVPADLEPWTLERAARRHPAFTGVRIVSRWSCFFEMTPDDHPVVGAVPGVEGLYLAAGFSGHGFMHSPAIAQLVVEEMLDGRATSLDISDLSLERFESGRRPFTPTVI